MFFQFFADVGVTGEAAGSLGNLGLNGKLSFQAFQLGFLWEGEPGRLHLGDAGQGSPCAPLPFLPNPPPPKGSQPSLLLGATGTRNPAVPLPNPYPSETAAVLFPKSLAAHALGTRTFETLGPCSALETRVVCKGSVPEKLSPHAEGLGVSWLHFHGLQHGSRRLSLRGNSDPFGWYLLSIWGTGGRLFSEQLSVSLFCGPANREL